MTVRVRCFVAIGMLLAVPLAGAQAACDTETARETTHIRYAQAMAPWQQNAAMGYEAAQEQFRADAAVAKRDGAVKQCLFWEKAIRAAHKAQ